MSVDVVIVNWNSGRLLKDCVDSIQQFGVEVIDTVVVVDNDSEDDSVEFLSALSDVQLIQANENLGFGKACNLGARHCSSEYILFLNPDAQLYEHSLATLLSFMESDANSSVGICGPQLDNEFQLTITTSTDI